MIYITTTAKRIKMTVLLFTLSLSSTTNIIEINNIVFLRTILNLKDKYVSITGIYRSPNGNEDVFKYI